MKTKFKKIISTNYPVHFNARSRTVGQSSHRSRKKKKTVNVYALRQAECLKIHCNNHDLYVKAPTQMGESDKHTHQG